MSPAKLVIISTACLALAACQTASPTQWVKAGASTADYNQDATACNYEAVKATAGGGTYGMRSDIGMMVAEKMKQKEIAVLCMQTKGWSIQPVAPT